MTPDLLRPLPLARRVLLPPLVVGAVAVCLLAAIAAAGGQREKASNALAPAPAGEPAWRLVAAVAASPSAADVRRARRLPRERRRLLARHPYLRLYRTAARRFGVPWLLVASVHYQETGFAKGRRVVMAIAAQLGRARARNLGGSAVRAVAARYGSDPDGRLSTAMVVERARAWRLLGALPLPGRGELATPTRGVVGGCGHFGCPRPGHMHNGVDMLAPTGTPVHAADLGRVAVLESVGQSGGYGNFVCLQHRPHLATCYAHLSSIAAGLRVGSLVRRGQVIGLVGSTGSSSAPHLHFEVRRGPASCQGCAVDPLPLLSGTVPRAVVPRMLQLAGARPSAAAAPRRRGPAGQDVAAQPGRRAPAVGRSRPPAAEPAPAPTTPAAPPPPPRSEPRPSAVPPDPGPARTPTAPPPARAPAAPAPARAPAAPDPGPAPPAAEPPPTEPAAAPPGAARAAAR